MHRIAAILSLVALCLIPVHALAEPITSKIVGSLVELTYVEPIINDNGTPLDDLNLTTIYYDIGQGKVKAGETPASVATGGATILIQISVKVPAGQRVTAVIWATATDTSGNESLPSPTVSEVIDRLPPAPPQ